MIASAPSRRPHGTWSFLGMLVVCGAAFLGSLHAATSYQNSAPPSGGRDTTAWFCPMHPDVTSDVTGRCRRCGMALIEGNPFDVREYRLDVSTQPAAIVPGRPVHLTLRVGHPDDGKAVESFELVHEQRFHLFVVSHDLTSFQHLHPELQSDGQWVIDVILPRPGYYRVLSDFVPTGGSAQFLGRTIATAGFDGDLAASPANQDADAVLSKTVGSIKADITFEPTFLTAGRYGHLHFGLSDARTGEPITDLQPYLGAFGHTLILSEDLVDSVHSHPTELIEGDANGSRQGGPHVTFEGYLPRPGRYRAWTQFLRGGSLTTVPLTFDVYSLEDALRLQRLEESKEVPGP